MIVDEFFRSTSISTRAPTRGATNLAGRKQRIQPISTHAPT